MIAMMLNDYDDGCVLDVGVAVGGGVLLAPLLPSPSPPAPLPPSGRGGYVLGGSRFLVGVWEVWEDWLVFGGWFWDGVWLVAMPRPFVRPGHPRPDPLPPSGRGDSPSSPPVHPWVPLSGDGVEWWFLFGESLFLEGGWLR